MITYLKVEEHHAKEADLHAEYLLGPLIHDLLNGDSLSLRQQDPDVYCHDCHKGCKEQEHAELRSTHQSRVYVHSASHDTTVPQTELSFQWKVWSACLLLGRARQAHLHPAEHAVEELADDEAGHEVGEHSHGLPCCACLQGVDLRGHLTPTPQTPSGKPLLQLRIPILHLPVHGCICWLKRVSSTRQAADNDSHI